MPDLSVREFVSMRRPRDLLAGLLLDSDGALYLDPEVAAGRSRRIDHVVRLSQAETAIIHDRIVEALLEGVARVLARRSRRRRPAGG